MGRSLLKVVAMALLAVSAYGAAPEDPVVRSIRERINMDAVKVGAVAHNLLAVQASVGAVEKEVLGKAFDVKTSTSIFAELKALRKQTVKQQASLQNRATALTRMESKAHACMLKGMAKDSKLQTCKQSVQLAKHDGVLQLTKAQAQIGALKTQLLRMKQLEQDNGKLREINAVIKQQLAESVTGSQKAAQQVRDAQAAQAAVTKEAKGYKDEMLKQHKYGATCKARVDQLERQLKLAPIVVAPLAPTVAPVTAIKPTTPQTKAVRAVQTPTATPLQTTPAPAVPQVAVVAAAQQQILIDGLQKQIVILTAQTVQAMQGKAASDIAAKTAQDQAIQANAKASVMATTKDGTITMLRGTLAGLNIVAYQSEITQLKLQVGLTQQALQSAQVSAAASATKAAEAEAARFAAQEAAKMNALSARKVAASARTEVAAAAKASAVAQTAAEQAALAANSQLASKCATVWETKNKKLRKKVKKFKVCKSDLSDLKAQTNTLKSTLAACQSAA